MASISDKITKTMDGQTPNTTTVSTQRVAGATELQARNLDGWPEDTAVHFTTYRVDSQGEVIDGSETDWKGVVSRSSNTIANLTRTGGAADQGNAADDVIEPMPTAAWGNELAEALLECHTTEGKLKPKSVALTSINGGPSAGVLKVDDNGTVTSEKIKASNIDLTSLPLAHAASTSQPEQSYPQATWVEKKGSRLTFKTTENNQKVVLIFSIQCYAGGYSEFRWNVDGAYTNFVKARTELGHTTTHNTTAMIVHVVPTAGEHTASLQIKSSSSTLRVLDIEGSGSYAAIPALG